MIQHFKSNLVTVYDKYYFCKCMVDNVKKKTTCIFAWDNFIVSSLKNDQHGWKEFIQIRICPVGHFQDSS